jgi:hypothetical protein
MRQQPTIACIATTVVLLAGGSHATATTLSVLVTQDTFVSSGGTFSPADASADFSALGAMMIGTPIGAQDRTMLSLLSFNTAAIASSFDAEFGAGQWVVTGVGLRLGSNFAQAGVQPNNSRFNVIRPGYFEFSYSTNDAWNGAAINWNSLPAYQATTSLTPLGTFYWAADGLTNPPGNPQYSTWPLNLVAGLLADITTGDEVTLLGAPADDQVNYLFNQQTRVGAEPYLDITAVAVPEPTTLALCTAMSAVGLRRRTRRA